MILPQDRYNVVDSWLIYPPQPGDMPSPLEPCLLGKLPITIQTKVASQAESDVANHNLDSSADEMSRENSMSNMDLIDSGDWDTSMDLDSSDFG